MSKGAADPGLRTVGAEAGRITGRQEARGSVPFVRVAGLRRLRSIDVQ
ncbi:hypothetical protein ACFPN0_15645 [Kitasatospora cinereorecta]